jgi:hypothetical protein
MQGRSGRTSDRSRGVDRFESPTRADRYEKDATVVLPALTYFPGALPPDDRGEPYADAGRTALVYFSRAVDGIRAASCRRPVDTE